MYYDIMTDDLRASSNYEFNPLDLIEVSWMTIATWEVYIFWSTKCRVWVKDWNISTVVPRERQGQDALAHTNIPLK
jgi:hypothetical protein